MDAAEEVTIMPTTDRQRLRFAEAVQDNFSFLHAHGFRRVRSDPTFTRFESKRIYVNVYHGRQSFEIGLEVAPVEGGPDEACFSMSEIVRLTEPERAAEYRNYAAQTTKSVAEGVQELAARFHRYIDAGVLDDPRLFQRLKESRLAWSRDYAKEVDLTQARRNLAAAWHAKNYVKVVEVLEPFRADLTSAELKKLEYAKKELG
jgi:hypothetical protein